MRATGRMTVWAGVGALCGGAALAYGWLTTRPVTRALATPPGAARPAVPEAPAPAAEVVRLRGHTDAVLDVAISADGRRIASGSNDRTAIVWDVATRKPLRRLEGHAAGVVAVGFSADGSRVMTASLDHTARVWDAKSGDLIAVLKGGHAKHVHDAAISPDGRRVVTVSCDHAAVLWDVATEKPLQTYPHPGEAHAAAFSPDGRTFLTGSRGHPKNKDAHLRLYDAASGELLKEFATPSGDGAAYAEGGKRAFVMSVFDLHVLDVEARELTPLKSQAGAGAFAPFPDGKRLLSGNFDTSLIDVVTGGKLGEVRREDRVQVRAMAVAPDGTWAVLGGGGQGNPWGTGKEAYHPAAEGDLRIVPVTPEGMRELSEAQAKARAAGAVAVTAVSADGGRLFALFGSGAGVWLDAATGAEAARFDVGPPQPATGAAASPDGKRVAVRVPMQGVTVYDAAGKSLGKFDVPRVRIMAVALGADERTAFVAGWRQAAPPPGQKLNPHPAEVEAFLVDVATGNPARTYTGPAGKARRLELSLDGKTLVALLDDTPGGGAAAVAWDVASARQLWTWAPPAGTPRRARLEASAFAGDGRAFALAYEKTVALIDAQTGKTQRELTGHETPVRRIAFDPDGERVWTSAASNDEVRAWDRATGRVVRAVKVQAEGVGFRPDGNRRLLLDVRGGKLVEHALEP
jgi:WD40 repeat protein